MADEPQTPDNDENEAQAILPFDDGSTGRFMRKEWHDGRWFFSVVDAVAILTDSTNPGTYWRVLKKRLTDEGFRSSIRLRLDR